MAGDWIKMRSNLATDPDVIDIAARVSMDEYGVVGRLQALWSWADQHSHDGTLPRATSAFVDRLTACPGFAEALRQVGWLEGRDSALRLPNWDRHNGNTAKARASETQRKQRQRDTTRDKCPAPCPDETGTTPGPEKRREEKKEQAGSAHAGEAEETGSDHPPGWEPPLAMFVAECARYSIPAWYAQVKWEVHCAKGWCIGRTPSVWKRIVPLVKRDFVNDGSPATEAGAAPNATPPAENGKRPLIYVGKSDI